MKSIKPTKSKPIKHSSWIIAYHGNGKDKKILLGKRAKTARNSNQWGFFGGTNDANELPNIAAKREFHEETGYDITDPIYHIGTHKTKIKHSHYFNFHAPKKFTPVLNTKETTTHKWVKLGNIKKLNLHHSVTNYLNYIQAKIKRKNQVKSSDQYPYGYWILPDGTLHIVLHSYKHKQELEKIEEKQKNIMIPEVNDLYLSAFLKGFIRIADSTKNDDLFIEFNPHHIVDKALNTLVNFVRKNPFNECVIDLIDEIRNVISSQKFENINNTLRFLHSIKVLYPIKRYTN